jgi:hypothetical protein
MSVYFINEIKSGTTIKREKFEYVGINPKTQTEEVTQRTKYTARDICYNTFSPELVSIVKENFWT